MSEHTLLIRRAALRLLARREHSTAELFRKLQQKAFNPTEIDTVLAALRQENLLDEARFIENFVYYKRNRGYGPLRIRAELLERGIAQDLIEHHLKITDNTWLEDMRKTWQKRFKGGLPRDFKSRAQQMRFCIIVVLRQSRLTSYSRLIENSAEDSETKH